MRGIVDKVRRVTTQVPIGNENHRKQVKIRLLDGKKEVRINSDYSEFHIKING